MHLSISIMYLTCYCIDKGKRIVYIMIKKNGKEVVMNITERVIDSPEKEGVILEYVNFTKEFAEIKEYVKNKGESIMGYTAGKECVPVRTEDVLYFESVDGRVFAYTVDDYYEIKGRLYQVEEKMTRKCMQRASKTTLVNLDHIVSVRTALNGRLYARMENEEEILVTRKYAKEISKYLMEIE